MHPLLDLYFTSVPTYGLMALMGFACAIILFTRTAKIYQIPISDALYACIYGLVGLMIGAKIVFFITTAPRFIVNFDVFLKYPWDSLLYMFGGWVFYGGLIGGAIGVMIYCMQFQMDKWSYGDAFAPVIPFFHVFGRIGCHLAGCCYGMEYHGPLAVTFPLSKYTLHSAGVPRFPTQLTEVCFNFILFLILYFYIKRKPKPGRPLGIYLTSYSIMRFTIEFFRGDIERGGLLGLSTSQWISLALLPLGVGLLVKQVKNIRPLKSGSV